MNDLKKYELKQRFNNLLTATGRRGMDRLLNWLEHDSDFYTAPASTKYHLSMECGLLQHSLNVYDALVGMMEPIRDAECPEPGCGETYYQLKVAGVSVGAWKESTLAITALLHDICKVNTYIQELKNRKVYKETGSKKDSQGRYDWESFMGYTFKDEDLPYGHGEKSVMLLMSFIGLNMEEKLAIRWHMGAFGLHDSREENTLTNACKRTPLVFALMQADQMASIYMEEEEQNKPGF